MQNDVQVFPGYSRYTRFLMQTLISTIRLENER